MNNDFDFSKLPWWLKILSMPLVILLAIIFLQLWLWIAQMIVWYTGIILNIMY